MSEAIFNLINQNLADIKSEITELRSEIKKSTSDDARLLEEHMKSCSWKQFEESVKKHLTRHLGAWNQLVHPVETPNER